MSKQYFMSRIRFLRDYQHPLLWKEGILSTGWSYLGGELDREKVKAQIRKDGGKTTSINAFLSMQIGDIVLVPSPYNRKFSVWQIESETLTQQTVGISELSHQDGTHSKPLNELDLGYFYRVKNIPIAGENTQDRSKYLSGPLNGRGGLSYLGTTLKLSKYHQEIEEILTKGVPVNHKDDLLKRLIPNVLEVIKEMGANQFEELIKNYFLKVGAKEAIIPPKNGRSSYHGDKNCGDVDCLATFDVIPGEIEHRVYLQAKWHNNVTPKQAVHQILDATTSVRFQNEISDVPHHSLWIISSAEFDEETEELALEHGIRLINGDEFAQMLLSVGVDFFPEEK